MQVLTTNSKTVYPIIFPIRYGQMESVNCYLYESNNKLTLIDAGLQTEEYIKFFNEKLAEYHFTYESIDQILLTHHHEDHIGMVNIITENNPIPIYAHESAVERIAFAETYLNNKQRFYTQLYKNYGCLNYAKSRLDKMQQTYNNRHQLGVSLPIIGLKEGDRIDDFVVWEAPGHSPDCIVFYEEKEKWSFAGDAVLYPGSSNALVDFDEQLMLLPTVNQLEHTFERMLRYETAVLFPGHQQPFSNIEEVIEIKMEQVVKKCERIIEHIEKGNATAIDLAYSIYGEKTTNALFGIIISEIIGYTTYAEIKGYVQKKWNGEQYIFELTK